MTSLTFYGGANEIGGNKILLESHINHQNRYNRHQHPCTEQSIIGRALSAEGQQSCRDRAHCILGNKNLRQQKFIPGRHKVKNKDGCDSRHRER